MYFTTEQISTSLYNAQYTDSQQSTIPQKQKPHGPPSLYHPWFIIILILNVCNIKTEVENAETWPLIILILIAL